MRYANWIDTCKKKKKRKKERKEIRPPTYTVLKNKLKIIKDLNVSCKNIKILEENISSKISDISGNSIFADVAP